MQKKRILFAVAFLSITLALALAIRATDKDDTDSGSQQVQTNQAKESAEVIKKYSNAQNKLDFSYLAGWNLTEETKATYDNGKKWNRITLTSPEPEESSRIIIEINPDGYGPIFSDDIYELKEDAEGQIGIAARKFAEPDDNQNDGWLIATANLDEASNGQSYHFRLENKEGDKDYEKLFESILTSTRIQK